MMSRFDDLKLEILFYLVETSYEMGSLWSFKADDVEGMVPTERIAGILPAALDALFEDGLLKNANDRFQLSPAGVRIVEGQLEDDQSELSRILNDLGYSLEEIRSSFSTGSHYRIDTKSFSGRLVPATDRTVNLYHNSGSYKEAISALDAAVTAFRDDHQLDNEWGPEKGILLRSIESGQELLKQSTVRSATVFTTIVTPLRIILDRYKDSIAAGLVTATADQLIPIIERAVSALLALIGMS
jgi:hypothetical protein